MHIFNQLCYGKCYLIPENQRGYSWGPQHVESVFDDLELATGKSHYVGPLIVTRSEREDFEDAFKTTTAEYILEDGQQRLTTWFLILNEIRVAIEERNGRKTLPSQELHKLCFFSADESQPRLRNRNRDLDAYLSNLLRSATQRIPLLASTPPMVSLEKAREEIVKILSPFDETGLVSVGQKLSNSAKFILVDLKNEGIDRYLAFDAINSRGLTLSEFDKIKNFAMLLKSRSRVSIDPAKEWYAALSNLQKASVSERSDEAAFIAELFSAYFDSVTQQDSVHEDFVKTFGSLLNSRNKSLEKKLEVFIGHWSTYSSSFGAVSTKDQRHRQKAMSPESKKWVTALTNMGLKTVTRPILVASHLKFSKSDFEKIARACEIYTFRLFGVARARVDKNKPFHVSLANRVLLGHLGADDVVTELRKRLKKDAPIAEGKRTLGDMRPKYDKDSDYKGWAKLYYFLYEYELGHCANGVAPIDWRDTDAGQKSTIEHILPQKHRDGDYWQQKWPDKKEADEYMHRLGNLVLTHDNSRLGNKAYPVKCNDKSFGYTHSNATSTEKLICKYGLEDWTRSSIDDREKAMIDWFEQRWTL